MGNRLTSRAIASRKAGAQDNPILLRLFAESQQNLLMALGQAAEPLIAMQYRGRATSYAKAYPNAEDFILQLEDGTPVARLLLDRTPRRWRIIDLAVLAEYRGQGIASTVLAKCQNDCRLSEAKLHLRVMRDNPALRFYERLGFIQIGGDELSIEMEWKTSGDDSLESRTALAMGENGFCGADLTA